MTVTRRRLLLAGLSLAAAPLALRASAGPRALWLRRAATGEEVKAVYSDAGGIDRDGYLRLCRLLRDVREESVVAIDPRLLDLMWSLQRQLVEGERPLEVLSGYRTAATNARTEGAALNSFHLHGRAVDLRIPGVGHDRLLEAGLALGAGGVGDYRDFIHLDTGEVRSWGHGGPLPIHSAALGNGLGSGLGGGLGSRSVLDGDLLGGLGGGLDPVPAPLGSGRGFSGADRRALQRRHEERRKAAVARRERLREPQG